MSEKPTHQDWQWFAWFLGKQRDWTPVINSGFSVDYTHETLSMLNLAIDRLNANKSVLERATYAVKTPGQARLVYREQVRNQNLFHELNEIRSKILVQLKRVQKEAVAEEEAERFWANERDQYWEERKRD